MSSRLFQSAHADRNRFITLYVAIVLGLLSAAGMFVYEARVIVDDGLRAEKAVVVLGVANRLLHDVDSAESGQRGYLLSGDESYLAAYQNGVDDLDDTLLRLQRVVAADASSVELIRRIEHAKTARVTELARTIELARAGNRNAALALLQTHEGRQQMALLRASLHELLREWRTKHRLAIRDARVRLMSGTVALAVVALFICCLLIYTLFIQRRAFAKVHAHSAALDQQAAQDALTGLANRRGLLSALAALSKAGADVDAAPGRVGLLYLDIDRFKSVNDALGLSAGDVLLRRLAAALQALVRPPDMLARVGGDEFVLLVPHCGDDAQLRELAGRLIARVAEVGDAEYGGRFPISASVGIATWPDRADTVERLPDIADAAMYAAKQGGRSTCRFGALPGRRRLNVVQMPR